jgi:two-component system cell cycle response regulator
MSEFIDRRRRDANANSDSATIRLLIVDDDANYRAWLSRMARRLGYDVSLAVDGADALVQLAESPFDVAVIDLDMPRVTGLEVISGLRSHDVAKTVYAIMLTGHTETETKLQALDAGFDDFMSKSSSEAELIAKLTAARRVAARQRTLDHTIRELYGMATRDALTGIFNRRFFLAEVDRMLARGTKMSVVLFDLDFFKQVNDTFGHSAGDQVLRDVGSIFLGSTRPEDLVARYGGDEFVMVVTDLDVPEVEVVAGRLCAAIAALQWSAGDQVFSIGVTTGFAAAHLLEQATIQNLLDAADRDLYKNKWIHRNPDVRPELYEYPRKDGASDVVLTVPTQVEVTEPEPRPLRADILRARPRV